MTQVGQTCSGLVAIAPHQVEVRTFDLPPPGPGQVWVQAAYTGVSPGTELRCLAGQQPGADFPFVAGYQCAGRVVACGEGVRLPVDTPVFCTGTVHTGPYARQWGGHVSHALVEARRVVVLQPDVSLRSACLLKLAAIAWHGLTLVDAEADSTVFVVGLGPLGQLSARLHLARGRRVLAADLCPRRVAIARAAGIDALQVKTSLAETVRQRWPGGADIVVDVTGSPGVLAQAVAALRDTPWTPDWPAGPCLVIQGSYAADPVLPLRDVFMKEARILVPRDHTWSDLEHVAGLLAARTLQLDDLLTTTCRPDAANEAYARLREQPDACMTLCFDWTGTVGKN